MYVHEHTIRVRYGETDQMGYVYYGDYAEYLEVGRVEALRSLGFPYRRLEEEGLMLDPHPLQDAVGHALSTTCISPITNRHGTMIF